MGGVKAVLLPALSKGALEGLFICALRMMIGRSKCNKCIHVIITHLRAIFPSLILNSCAHNMIFFY